MKHAHRERQRARLHALFQSHQGFGLTRRLDDQHARRIEPQVHHSASRQPAQLESHGPGPAPQQKGRTVCPLRSLQTQGGKAQSKTETGRPIARRSTLPAQGGLDLMQTAGLQSVRQQGVRSGAPQPPRHLAARSRLGGRPQRRALDARDFLSQAVEDVCWRRRDGTPPSHRNGRGEFYRSGRAGLTSPARSTQGQQDEGGVSRRIHGRRLATRKKTSKATMCCSFFVLTLRTLRRQEKWNGQGTA